MKALKVEFKYAFAQGMIQLIDDLLSKRYEDDDDKIVMAALLEVKQRLYLRMANTRAQYTITMTPVQSIALRILATQFINNHKSYMGSKLLKIANDVEKTFTSWL